MSVVATVSAAITRLFGETADAIGRRVAVIQRQRKFTATTLLQTFVLGYLKNPRADDAALAQMAARCGVSVTPQAIDQRHTPALADFLREAFAEAARTLVAGNRVLAPILERFTGVWLMDGSTVTLPAGQADPFPGGGTAGPSAAVKLQTTLDLRSGAVTVALEPGRQADGATPRLHERRGPRSLAIRDLGYFNLTVFAAMMAADEGFLSRLQYGTLVQPQGESVWLGRDAAAWRAWLLRHPGPFVDVPIRLGRDRHLPCRMIAWRLPPEVANRRRQKLRADTRDAKGREPSADRLAWCDWTILVTNVSAHRLTPKEAAVLYRARWQVELLFKRWKSLNLVAVLSGSTEARQMVRVWGRLLTSLLQHWLLLATVWGDARQSLTKASLATRDIATELARSLAAATDVAAAIDELAALLRTTARRNRRSKPGTFELLNNVDLLDFRLT